MDKIVWLAFWIVATSLSMTSEYTLKRLLNSSLLIIAATIILILFLAMVNLLVLRVILFLPLLLFLPGYAITGILFPPGKLGIPERLLISVGLSVVVTMLSGLILHWTPWGLRPTALWVVLLAWWILIQVVSIIRIRNPGAVPAIRKPIRLEFNYRQWVFLILAALVVTGAIYVARTPVPQQGLEGYTLLWLEPTESSEEVRIGVRSEEFAAIEYQLRFEVDDVLHEGLTLELQPGESWRGSFRLLPNQPEDRSLTVLLYRLDEPAEVYRHVVWWPEASSEKQGKLP